MSMHLEKPYLTTTGKKKGPVKYKSAEAKREAERLAAEWEELQKRHKTKSTKPMQKPKYTLKHPPGRDAHLSIPSLGDGVGNGPAKTVLMYTGDKILGIAVQHKSCLQPIYNEQEAKDSASMRR